MFKHILVAIDGSSYSQKALPRMHCERADVGLDDSRLENHRFRAEQMRQITLGIDPMHRTRLPDSVATRAMAAAIVLVQSRPCR
ncbi:MAG TPA: hypothetical protein VIO37_10260 [Candidatus Dormibacteraeota bacterium]|jgi:hypothetical protein